MWNWWEVARMLNYLKGEFYKVFHRKSFYVFTGVISLLAIATNVLSCFYGRPWPGRDLWTRSS